MISVEQNDKITPKLRAMSSSVETILQQLIEEESQALLPFVQQNTPVGTHFDFDGTERRGGQLKDSLQFVIGQWGSYLAGAKQGIYVVSGTKPHPIAPREANALAFFWPKVGSGVVRKHVNHPGTKKNDFRQEGLQQAMDEMALQDVASRIMAEWVSQ